MKMNEYLTALQTHLATQQSTNQNILDLLFDAYSETTGLDNAAIKADFERLYEIMNGKPLQEIDESSTLSVPTPGITKKRDLLRVLRLASAWARSWQNKRQYTGGNTVPPVCREHSSRKLLTPILTNNICDVKTQKRC